MSTNLTQSPASPYSLQSGMSVRSGITSMNIAERCRPLSITRESQIISGICLLDLAVTLALLSRAEAVEGNPLMGFYLQFGVGAFVLAKLALLFFPIFIAEWARQYRPAFTRNMLRFAIIAYLGTYALLFVHHNVPVLMANVEYTNITSGRVSVDQAKPQIAPENR